MQLETWNLCYQSATRWAQHWADYAIRNSHRFRDGIDSDTEAKPDNIISECLASSFDNAVAQARALITSGEAVEGGVAIKLLTAVTDAAGEIVRDDDGWVVYPAWESWRLYDADGEPQRA